MSLAMSILILGEQIAWNTAVAVPGMGVYLKVFSLFSMHALMSRYDISQADAINVALLLGLDDKQDIGYWTGPYARQLAEQAPAI